MGDIAHEDNLDQFDD